MIGSVEEADLSRYCVRNVPAAGAPLRFAGPKPRDQIVMTVTPTKPGEVRIAGLDVGYRAGWRRGAQVIGSDVEVHQG